MCSVFCSNISAEVKTRHVFDETDLKQVKHATFLMKQSCNSNNASRFDRKNLVKGKTRHVFGKTEL